MIRKQFHSSPHLTHGSAWIRWYIPLAANSLPDPLPLNLPWPRWLRTGITTPDVCVSKTRTEYLSPSEASGCCYQAARNGWLGGGQSHGRTGYFKCWGLALGDGAAGTTATLAPCGSSCCNGKGGREKQICIIMSLPPLQLAVIESLGKCAVSPPV